jgi:hypothetical protein
VLNPALKPFLPPPNWTSNLISPAPSVISVGMCSAMNHSRLHSLHPSLTASQLSHCLHQIHHQVCQSAAT